MHWQYIGTVDFEHWRVHRVHFIDFHKWFVADKSCDYSIITTYVEFNNL